MVQARPMSFDLNAEMLKLVHQEFGAQVVAEKLVAALAGKTGAAALAVAEQFFTRLGKEWGQRTVQLGQEYSDRTWEVLRAAADSTDDLKFGLFPLRFLEIAYLATQDIATLPVIESSRQKLVYQLVECTTYKALKAEAGEEVMAGLPCRHCCVALVESIHEELGIDAAVEMTATMNKDGRCEFSVKKI